MSDMSIADIERMLADERAALAGTLDRLGDRLTPATLLEQGKTLVQSQAAPVTGALDRAVRARPVTAAIAGIAVAALAFGARSASPQRGTVSALAGTRLEALSRWEDEGGPVSGPVNDPVGDAMALDHADPEGDWLEDAVSIGAKARALLSRIDAAARSGIAPVAELAAHRTEALRAFARDIAAALGQGLDGLAAPARKAVLAQRERAYQARMALSGSVRQSVHDRPVAAGLAAAAAGAAIACLFRPTEAEDRVLGPARDEVIARVGQTLRDEIASASHIMQALSDAAETDFGRIRSLWSGTGRTTAPATTPTRH